MQQARRVRGLSEQYVCIRARLQTRRKVELLTASSGADLPGSGLGWGPQATRLRCRPRLTAVAPHLQAAYHDMEAAIALDLPFQTVEQVALELGDLAAAQACH